MCTIRCKGICRRSYSLIEMLAVMAVGMVLMTASMHFFYQGRKECITASNNLQDSQLINLLAKAWRNNIHKNGELYIIQNNNIIFKNRNSIKLVQNELIIENQNSGKKKYKLPKNVNSSITIETQNENTALLVLELRNPKNDKDCIRIVAAAGKEIESK